MAFMVKHMVGGQLKNLTGGLTEEKPEGEKTEAAAQGMTQEEFEQYQQQLEEEKQEREANFAQKKAERATVRSHFRDKYRLPKNELDETQIQQAGDDVELPTELAKMIAQDNQEEEHKQSVLGQLTNIQNVDMDQLKDKAQATLEDLKKQTENCSLMRVQRRCPEQQVETETPTRPELSDGGSAPSSSNGRVTYHLNEERLSYW
ncbi:Complexin-3 [Merluccius polli]|uniref:Complexin-3 n=1 Tax=Merluccius polli TaxID=89951 RepID=A0AA47M1B9_MERPO|nr:Complexin-3 [Merluccius polli]